jgi:hypothetical protein
LDGLTAIGWAEASLRLPWLILASPAGTEPDKTMNISTAIAGAETDLANWVGMAALDDAHETDTYLLASHDTVRQLRALQEMAVQHDET